MFKMRAGLHIEKLLNISSTSNNTYNHLLRRRIINYFCLHHLPCVIQYIAIFFGNLLFIFLIQKMYTYIYSVVSILYIK